MLLREPSTAEAMATAIAAWWGALKASRTIKYLYYTYKWSRKLKGGVMLEGKELEGAIGQIGTYSVDVSAEGKVMLELQAIRDFGGVVAKSSNTIEIALMSLLEQVAAKTESKWDDQVIAMIKGALGLK